MSEPECKCFSPSYHEKDCAYKAWVKAGKPVQIDSIAVPSHNAIVLRPGINTSVPINCLYIGTDNRLGKLDPVYMATMKGSLKAHGLQKPLYVTTTGEILDGRIRWRLLIELGHTEVAVGVAR